MVMRQPDTGAMLKRRTRTCAVLPLSFASLYHGINFRCACVELNTFFLFSIHSFRAPSSHK